jgi:hypothetical protein
VLSVVIRRGPPATLRHRKARPNQREAALRDYEEQLRKAWQGT